MAKTKSAGSSRLGRDSNSQRLGVKVYAGETIKTGEIIVRQRGAKLTAGLNTRRGGDDTIYATKTGVVSFSKKTKKNFDGSTKVVGVVTVK